MSEQHGPALVFRKFGLAHRRPDGEDVLLADVDLELPTHGFYAFVGASGGGKSSLLRILAGLVETREPAPKMSGELLAWGEPVTEEHPESLRDQVAAILQDEGLLDELTTRENVELALRAADRSPKLAAGLLAQVGLEHAPARPAQLSGGMRKRLAVARALAQSPRLLLCDEPTAGLDAEAARTIAKLLREAHDQDAQRTTLVITHDLDAFAGIADGVLVLDRQQRTLRLERRDYQPSQAENVRRSGAVQAGEPAAVHALRRLLLRLAAIGETVMESLRRLPPFELGLVLRTVARCVCEPILFVAIAGAVIGGLSTFFALKNNPVHGGFESSLLTGTGKVATAVLVPLLTGFFFTARMVAGAAARLGTMKRTNQIAALQTMGIRPADYLLTPLVWGMVVAMPLVTLAGVVAASAAGFLAARVVSGFTTVGWATAWFASVDPRDMLVVLAKTTLSGYLIAVTCYHLGTGPKRSGAEVGEAVNRAIVVGMALVLAVHAGLTFLVYA
ncbi:MAG: ABC transporter permease [Planctomycetota bacterium]|jgi:ABC-type multidrug transport system ATPase subunit/ABC-type transporter Mla maintaining outer membrane lipid asymmetry permease subunit MlaE